MDAPEAVGSVAAAAAAAVSNLELVHQPITFQLLEIENLEVPQFGCSGSERC